MKRKILIVFLGAFFLLPLFSFAQCPFTEDFESYEPASCFCDVAVPPWTCGGLKNYVCNSVYKNELVESDWCHSGKCWKTNAGRSRDGSGIRRIGEEVKKGAWSFWTNWDKVSDRLSTSFKLRDSENNETLASVDFYWDGSSENAEIYYYQPGTGWVKWFEVPENLQCRFIFQWDLTPTNPDDRGIYAYAYCDNGTGGDWTPNLLTGTLKDHIDQFWLDHSHFTSDYAGYNWLYIDDFKIWFDNAPPTWDTPTLNLTKPTPCQWNTSIDYDNIELQGHFSVPYTTTTIEYEGLYFFFENNEGKIYQYYYEFDSPLSGGDEIDFNTTTSIPTSTQGTYELFDVYTIAYPENEFAQQIWLLECNTYLTTSSEPVNITPPGFQELEVPELENCDDYDSITDRLLCEIKNAIKSVFIPSAEKIYQLRQARENLTGRFPFGALSALKDFASDVSDYVNDEENQKIEIGLFGTSKTYNADFFENLPVVNTIFDFLKSFFTLLILIAGAFLLKKEVEILIHSLS